MAIKRLQIRNFKSYRQVEFELASLNILIGANGVGKSNLISFFRMMAMGASKQLGEYVFGAGGLDELRWRGAAKTEGIEWQIDFDDAIEPELRYSGRMIPVGNSRFLVDDEEVSRAPYDRTKDRWKFLVRRDGRVVIFHARSQGQYNPDPGGADEFTNERDTEFILAQRSVGGALGRLRETMSDWTTFRGFGEKALENIHQAQQMESVSPLRLKADGSNLASVIQTLAADYPDFKEELDERLTSAFPDFRELVIRPVGTGRVELMWRDTRRWQFPAQSLSDGMLRFIGLATLLNLPDLPPLILIDEPEIGLHPRLIPLLGGLLRNAALRTQLIVTTHSPELLNAPDIALEDIVLVDAVDGETRLSRPRHTEYLDLWLKKYQGEYGRLWVMDKLK